MRKTPFLLVFLAVLAVQAQDQKDTQPAALPAKVMNSKTAFIQKGVGATAHTVEGGYDLAFDAFCSEMKSWGRYELLASPEAADLLMEVSYAVTEGGTSEYGITDPNTLQTTMHSVPYFVGKLSLVVYDNPTKKVLWSTSVAPGSAVRKKNQEKDMIMAGQELARNLEQRVGGADIAPSPSK
jgi:hypothetical protein